MRKSNVGPGLQFGRFLKLPFGSWCFLPILPGLSSENQLLISLEVFLDQSWKILDRFKHGFDVKSSRNSNYAKSRILLGQLLSVRGLASDLGLALASAWPDCDRTSSRVSLQLLRPRLGLSWAFPTLSRFCTILLGFWHVFTFFHFSYTKHSENMQIPNI